MSRASKLRKSLLSCIDDLAEHRSEYCVNPAKDFTRKRKLNFASLVKNILCLSGKTLKNEILDLFGVTPENPTASAFVQQRSKIKSEAFYRLFRNFTSSNRQINLFRGFRLLAVDGSELYTPKNKKDIDSLQINHSKYNNIYLLNALYDLNSHIYEDAVIQTYHHMNEHIAFNEMVDRYDCTILPT